MEIFKRPAQVYGSYDVVIAGGGPAGIGAGIAAARAGLRAILLERGGYLGGVATAGALPFILGAYNGSVPYRQMLKQGLQYRDLPRPRRAVGGIFTEITQRIKAADGGVGPCGVGQADAYPSLERFGCHDEFTFDIEIAKRVLEEMALEAGLEILYYTAAVDTDINNGEIRGVFIVNKGGLQFLSCKALIDCTGDADLISRSGFKTYIGDRVTGEMTFISFVTHIENIDAAKLAAYIDGGGDPWFYEACRKAKEKATATEAERALLPDSIIVLPMVQPGVFAVNGGTGFDWIDGKNLSGVDPRDLTEISVRGRQRAKYLVEQVFRPYIPGAQNCRLRYTAAYPGVRETRRIVAERPLTERDLVEGTKFADTIALAGRHFDLRRKEDVEQEKHGGMQAFAGKNKLGGGIAAIPYSALIPAGSVNVLAAGRCIAADGQALGPARIMSTCIAVGQAAGTAASLKVRSGASFQNIDVHKLRRILRENGAEVDP